MKWTYLSFGLLVLSVHFSDVRGTKPGAQDGKNSPQFNHDAILDSRKEKAGFNKLSPEETKKRLRKMVKKVDVDGDGQVTKNELVDWILKSFRKLDTKHANEEFKYQDVNNNGEVTWKEFTDYHYDNDYFSSTDVASAKKEKEEDHVKFNAADKNRDHQLNRQENLAFHIPHLHEYMHDHEIDKRLLKNDKDKDGFITFEEFRIKDVGDNENRKQFNEYDLSNDGYLDRKEIKPWALSDDHRIATDETTQLMIESDENNDGQLSIEEIEVHHNEFVQSMATEYGVELHNFKDEL